MCALNRIVHTWTSEGSVGVSRCPYDTGQGTGTHPVRNVVLRKLLRRLHYPLEIMLVCVRWYAAYPLSLRNLEQMMTERGVAVNHATMHRWALKILPALAKVFRSRKHPGGPSWRVDETYIKVNCEWKFLYRAADRRD